MKAPGIFRAARIAVSVSPKSGPAVQITERDQRARSTDDEACPFEPHCRNQQSNSRSDGMLQRLRNRRDQMLAQSDACRQDEYRTGEGDGAERNLPRHVHREHDRVGKEEVVTHRRRNGDRIIRQERHERRRQRRGQAGRDEDCAEVHAGSTQHGRLHEHDVRHREERGETSQEFRPDGSAVCGERETAL
jgi:hypothetical protein